MGMEKGSQTVEDGVDKSITSIGPSSNQKGTPRLVTTVILLILYLLFRVARLELHV